MVERREGSLGGSRVDVHSRGAGHLVGPDFYREARGGCECTVGEPRGKISLLTSANTFDGGDGKRWGVEGVVVVTQVAGRQIKSCIGL